jgi:hypothetical protein
MTVSAAQLHLSDEKSAKSTGRMSPGEAKVYVAKQKSARPRLKPSQPSTPFTPPDKKG